MADTKRMTAEQVVSYLLEEDGLDFLRESLSWVVQQLMEAEVSELVGAARGERLPEERLTHRNGYRSRSWSTRAGEIELAIPKIRRGSYFPSFLEPRKRSEQALVSVVQEAFVAGVSTRKVDQVVESLGLRISKSEVSRICADVISIRARTADGTIRYRVVDEYWDEGSEFAIAPVSSDRLLSLGELVELIDTAERSDDSYDGLVEGHLEALTSEVSPPRYPGELEGFVSVESGFYPQLRRYYELRCQAWLEATIEEFEEEEMELVCERVKERLEQDADFARELREAIPAGHIGDRLDWEGQLSSDISGETIRRIVDVSPPEVWEISRLGDRRYEVQVAVAATVEVDSFIPKREEPHDPSVAVVDDLGRAVEILDGDFDRSSMWVVRTADLYLGRSLVYDGAIGDVTIALAPGTAHEP